MCQTGVSRPAKLFIGGITRHTTTKQLRDHFAQYGRVLDCVAMRQPDGRPRGFGYVTLDSPAAADRCLAVPQVIDGRVVDMKRAVPEGSEGSYSMGYDQVGHSPMGSDYYMGQHHPSMFGMLELPGLLPPDMIYGAVTTPTGAYWGAPRGFPAMEAPGLGRSKVAGLEVPDCVELLSGLRSGGRAPGLGRAPLVPMSAPPTPTGASSGGMLNAGAAEFVPMFLPQKVVPDASQRRSPLQPMIFTNDENLPAPRTFGTEVKKVGLSENESKAPQSQQAKRPRAVLGEITNITNTIANGQLVDQIKKNSDLMQKVDCGIVGKKGIFAGSENAGQESFNQAPASARGLKLMSTRKGSSDFDICLDDEDIAVRAAAPDADDSADGQSEQTAPACPAPGLDEADVCLGELPSMGSAEHSAGTCKRCNFFPKGRCQNGKDCTFCHFPHDKRKPSRQEKRERRAAWLAQREDGDMREYISEDDNSEDGEEYPEFQQTMAYSILPGLPPMRATKLPAPLALPGSGEVASFTACMPPPGLAPQQRVAPPMLDFCRYQADEEVGPVRYSPMAAQAQRSMSVLSTAPMGAYSTPHSLAPSPTASHAAASFVGCSAPPTPSGAGMAVFAALSTSPTGAYSAKVMCTMGTQTEQACALCQLCRGDKQKCMCASSPADEKVWSREEMLRVREAATVGGQPASLRTVPSASLEGQ